jgi:hypothetical protein
MSATILTTNEANPPLRATPRDLGPLLAPHSFRGVSLVANFGACRLVASRPPFQDQEKGSMSEVLTRARKWRRRKRRVQTSNYFQATWLGKRAATSEKRRREIRKGVGASARNGQRLRSANGRIFSITMDWRILAFAMSWLSNPRSASGGFWRDAVVRLGGSFG